MDAEPSQPVDALLARLADLDAKLTSAQYVAAAKVNELRRQATARPRRRGGPGSADSRKYAIGGAVVLLAGEIDATTLLGLFAQTDMMLRWMAEERLAHGHQPFGSLLGAVLADQRKADWCRRWGAIIEWSHRKALYDASVTSFEASGRAGPHEPWRQRDVTDDQADLIETLCTLLGKSTPTLVDRGGAYEWIKEHGGNPTYWAPPPHPDIWSE